jgi:hypothetical protein
MSATGFHGVGPGGRECGQALLETAITIPLMLLFLLGFLAVLVRVEAQLERDAPTRLAAPPPVAAPAGSPLSAEYARETWAGTLRQYAYLQPGALDGCTAYQPGQTVTCQGSATLDYRETPMGLLVPLPIRIDSTATARSSEYRSR